MARMVKSHAARVIAAVEKLQVASDEVLGDAHTIVSSWRRCLLEHGLEPDRAPLKDAVLEAGEIRVRRERLGGLYPIACREIENLRVQTAGSGHLVALTDVTGALLECVSEQTVEQTLRRSGVTVGSVWGEPIGGTGGIGTCLAEGQPISIHRNEHFFQSITSMSCSVAPIFSPKGALLAALNVSTVAPDITKPGRDQTLELVKMASYAIENAYFLEQNNDKWILRFHPRPEFIGLLHEGLLALDEDGVIRGVNSNARTQIGCESVRELVNSGLDDVFDLSVVEMHRRAEEASVTVWPMQDARSGKRYFALAHAPEHRQKKPLRQHDSTSSVRGTRPTNEAAVHQSSPLTRLADGQDPKIDAAVRQVERVMDKDIVIMIQGETGTGKEIIARATHDSSTRASQPFVAVNCASIPESLIESELFGYKGGAFTGAKREGMRGKILESTGGTLFLDEIGDMPAELQTRLLRVLEEREVLPLGATKPIPVDLHVISATHCDLANLIDLGTFREDLYFRLNGLTIELPALRDRHDKERLIHTMLDAEREPGTSPAIDQAAFERLCHYAWPGNLRELRNVLRTALALCQDEVIRLEDLPSRVVKHAGTCRADPENPEEPSSSLAARVQDRHLKSVMKIAERDALISELASNNWNITITSRNLAVSRMTLYRKIRKYGISIPRP